MNLKHGGGLHDVLHASRIVDARELHQNLVVTQTVLLDDRLAHAEGIDASANGVDGLLHGAGFQCQGLGGLHHQRIAVFGSGLEIVTREIVADDAAKVARLVGRDAANLDYLRTVGIGHDNVREGDAAFIELVAQSLGGPLAVSSNSLVDCDLQYQVSATLEVQPAMNVLLNRGEGPAGAHRRPATVKIGAEEDAVGENQQNRNDEDRLAE